MLDRIAMNEILLGAASANDVNCARRGKNGNDRSRDGNIEAVGVYAAAPQRCRDQGDAERRIRELGLDVALMRDDPQGKPEDAPATNRRRIAPCEKASSPLNHGATAITTPIIMLIMSRSRTSGPSAISNLR
jgi:hypothetical protein